MEFTVNDKYTITIPDVKPITSMESAIIDPVYKTCLKIEDLNNAFTYLNSMSGSYSKDLMEKAFEKIEKYPDLYKSIIGSMDLIIRSVYDETVRELTDSIVPISELTEFDGDEEQYIDDAPILIPDEDIIVDDTEESEDEEVVSDYDDEYSNEYDEVISTEDESVEDSE